MDVNVATDGERGNWEIVEKYIRDQGKDPETADRASSKYSVAYHGMFIQELLRM